MLEKDRISALFADPEAMDKVLEQAIRETLRAHKRAGNYVVTWRDGKVLRVAPEDIPVDAESEGF